MKDYIDRILAKGSLLDTRKKELRQARLDLIRFEDLLSRKPNNAYLICEVDRYRSRIDMLELAIQTLERKC